MLGRSACTSRSAANFRYPRSPYAAAKLYAHWFTRSTVSRSAMITSHWHLARRRTIAEPTMPR